MGILLVRNSWQNCKKINSAESRLYDYILLRLNVFYFFQHKDNSFLKKKIKINYFYT
jgi:hypothetical protein